MSVIEVTEDSVKECIKTGKVVVKAWMDDCSYCDEFEPVFQDASSLPNVAFCSINIPASGSSEFRRTWMKSSPGEQSGAPAIFVFQDGELKWKHHGKMDLPDLIKFIHIGDKPVKAQISFDSFIESASIDQLKMAIYDHNRDREIITMKLNSLNNRIEYLINKKQPQKAQ